MNAVVPRDSIMAMHPAVNTARGDNLHAHARTRHDEALAAHSRTENQTLPWPPSLCATACIMQMERLSGAALTTAPNMPATTPAGAHAAAGAQRLQKYVYLHDRKSIIQQNAFLTHKALLTTLRSPRQE